MEKDIRTGYPPGAAAQMSLDLEIHVIPVAPKGHALFSVEFFGELGCVGAGANCYEAVFDDTPAGIVTVFNSTGSGTAVIRRPNLQMPDIALVEQEGHAAEDTTVFRLFGTEWKPYRCKSVAPIGKDPNPAVVADKPCAP